MFASPVTRRSVSDQRYIVLSLRLQSTPPARGVVREKNGYSTRRWSIEPSDDDWCSSVSCQRLWKSVRSLYRNVVDVRSGSDETSNMRLFPMPRRLSSDRPNPACRRAPDMPKLMETPVVHWSCVSTTISAPPGTGRAEMFTGLRKPVPRRMISLSASCTGSRPSPTRKSSRDRMKSSRVSMWSASAQRYGHADVAGSSRSNTSCRSMSTATIGVPGARSSGAAVAGPPARASVHRRPARTIRMTGPWTAALKGVRGGRGGRAR
jgi:hypothetical protein